MRYIEMIEHKWLFNILVPLFVLTALLYAYQQAPDGAKITWTPKTIVKTITIAPGLTR